MKTSKHFVQFVQEGFCLLSPLELRSLTSTSSSDLIPDVLKLLRSPGFRNLHESSVNSVARDHEDDPTSLGLQFFKEIHQNDKFCKISGFGSPNMINFLKHAKGYNSKINLSQDEESIILDSIPNEFESCMLNVVKNLSNCGEKLVHSILDENTQNDNIIYSKNIHHESLINFYTNITAPMYPHVDHSTITLLIIPSLLYLAPDTFLQFHNIQKPTFMNENIENENFKGLQVQNKSECWVSIDNLIYKSLRENKFNVDISKFILVLAGNHLHKLKSMDGKFIDIPIPIHQITPTNRHVGRFSIAHFMHRNLFTK